ncbi:MAG: phosphoenolpyruvate carboxykinase (ATP) [Acidimicrobiaceae bacterium TMED77]|nr:phosphoenolpyruvate carboxykinase (ATP) [Acidimicrobiales bacterium]OUV00046.1 MAG: phosphoenolpyruvate carboxykinase (ATP) [Acidimicrobiaceae bacterium TMED77]|tara:strand:- start:52 stop:1722 length:1671 start_codon:yes stop_codon:yes gene_type:complete
MNDTPTPNISESLKAQFGIDSVTLHYGLSQDELFKAAIDNDRGKVDPDGDNNQQKAYQTALGLEGPLVYYSDPSCTGRPVNDTFAVSRPEVEETVWWKKGFDRFDPDAFDQLLARVVEYLNNKKGALYVTDVFCGWDPEFAEPYRFVGEYATHAYFCNIMFPKAVRDDSDRTEAGWTILNVPSFLADPERDGTKSNRAVIMDIVNRIALVVGPADYCGVNKKTMFTVMNFVLPNKGQLSMHCSANVGPENDSAILFGLSGTGKTTLSADPGRLLIGDDEHVWTDTGVSNFEDGCYAKLIDLDKDAEPVIAAALSMKGTLIENVPPLPEKSISETDPQDFDLTDGSRTENTRFAYPLTCNPGVANGAKGPHPKTIVLLTADAFGVLPPVSILNPDEVMYHFVTGFTSKLAGTEVGITEPQATFSACFGDPFMSQKPSVYAELLAKRMDEHDTRCILLNTGWTGGPYGTGNRMSLRHTRALLNAALSGEFDDSDIEIEPILNLRMPTSCPDVPNEILNPRSTWSNPEDYDAQASKLRDMFRENYAEKGFADLGIAAAM